MTDVGKIAKTAFKAAKAAVTGVVHDATISYSTNIAYDVETGAYSAAATTLSGGEAIILTEKPIGDIFPDYTVGPTDLLIMLRGFTTAPQEGWSLTFNSKTYEIKQVSDVVGAGALFYAVAA